MPIWGRRGAEPDTSEAHAGCAKHPSQLASSACARCQRACCETCSLDVAGRTLCIDCGFELAGVRARRRRPS